jgi:hypothetical protein
MDLGELAWVERKCLDLFWCPSDNKCLWFLPKVDKGLDRWIWHHNLTKLLPWQRCTKTGPNIKGNILGVDIELTPSVSFEFGQENNNTMNATNYGKLTVKLPLGNKPR